MIAVVVLVTGIASCVVLAIATCTATVDDGVVVLVTTADAPVVTTVAAALVALVPINGNIRCAVISLTGVE